MLQKGTDRLRPETLDWLFKNYDDTNTDKRSWHTKQIPSELIHPGGKTRHYEILEHINPLNPELNPICYLLALLAHHFLHVSRIMVISLTLKLLMSYKYGAHILDFSRSHTTTYDSR